MPPESRSVQPDENEPESRPGDSVETMAAREVEAFRSSTQPTTPELVLRYLRAIRTIDGMDVNTQTDIPGSVNAYLRSTQHLIHMQHDDAEHARASLTHIFVTPMPSGAMRVTVGRRQYIVFEPDSRHVELLASRVVNIHRIHRSHPIHVDPDILQSLGDVLKGAITLSELSARGGKLVNNKHPKLAC